MASEYRELIERVVKDTVGYSEAENKKSFMIGVSVAISKYEEVLGEQIETLSRNVEFYKKAYESVTKDITTIVKIFNQYETNE